MGDVEVEALDDTTTKISAAGVTVTVLTEKLETVLASAEAFRRYVLFRIA